MAWIIPAARDLRSDGSNPEYDRALVELTATLLGCDTDADRDAIEHLILRED